MSRNKFWSAVIVGSWVTLLTISTLQAAVDKRQLEQQITFSILICN